MASFKDDSLAWEASPAAKRTRHGRLRMSRATAAASTLGLAGASWIVSVHEMNTTSALRHPWSPSCTSSIEFQWAAQSNELDGGGQTVPPTAARRAAARSGGG